MAAFTLYAVKGDSAPTQTLLLKSDGAALDLSDASEVHFLVPSWSIDITCTITDAANGEVTFDWGTNLASASGAAKCQVKIVWNDGTVQYVPNDDWGNLIVRPNE